MHSFLPPALFPLHYAAVGFLRKISTFSKNGFLTVFALLFCARVEDFFRRWSLRFCFYKKLSKGKNTCLFFVPQISKTRFPPWKIDFFWTITLRCPRGSMAHRPSPRGREAPSPLCLRRSNLRPQPSGELSVPSRFPRRCGWWGEGVGNTGSKAKSYKIASGNFHESSIR